MRFRKFFIAAMALSSIAPTAFGQSAEGPEGQGAGDIAEMPMTDAEQAQVERARQQNESEYQQALDAMMPLTPDQIERTQQAVKRRQRALRGTPSPDSRSQTVRVDVGPGGTPPEVEVSGGYASALTVLDATGKPWPINAVTVADDSAFQVLKPVEEGPGSSVLTIVPLLEYAHTNMIVQLADLATPVIVRLQVVDDANNDRMDMVVNGRGPNALAPVAARKLASPDNPVMRYLLDGVPPDNARRVEITGGPAGAWLVDGSFYLRSRLPVISPAWVSSLSGSGGVTVYELPILPTIVVSDTDGQPLELRVAQNALIDGALATGATTLGALEYGPGSLTSE